MKVHLTRRSPGTLSLVSCNLEIIICALSFASLLLTTISFAGPVSIRHQSASKSVPEVFMQTPEELRVFLVV